VTAIESLIEMSLGVAVRFVERQISFSLFAPLRRRLALWTRFGCAGSGNVKQATLEPVSGRSRVAAPELRELEGPQPALANGLVQASIVGRISTKGWKNSIHGMYLSHMSLCPLQNALIGWLLAFARLCWQPMSQHVGHSVCIRTTYMIDQAAKI
jgi:hypothetical protein